MPTDTKMFFHRRIGKRTFSGRRASLAASGSRPGIDTMYVGERWSIVTCPAPPATIAGTSVTAVAPEPITTTYLSA